MKAFRSFTFQRRPNSLFKASFAEMYETDKLTGGHVIMLGPGNTEAVRKIRSSIIINYHTSCLLNLLQCFLAKFKYML